MRRSAPRAPRRLSAGTRDDGLPPEKELVARLRDGDEALFVRVVGRYHASLVRLAMRHVGSRAVAEEVVQDAWIGVLRGIDRFEGRSSFRTWLHRIVTYTARTRSARESRSVPFSSLHGDEDPAPSVEPERFLPADHARWPGHWASVPANWEALPEERLESEEARRHIRAAMAALPPKQGEVVRLRDVEGRSPEEVCDLLMLSPGNQRVLLHRARSRLRAALEAFLSETDGDAEAPAGSRATA
jgi:RNA polymerase sigma-70 factor, ECF subfamily